MAHAQTRAAQREVSIEIVAGLHARWFGTAEQLTAEGLIPPGFKWPTDHGCKWWEAAGFHMIVVRDVAHPNGHDTWCLSRRAMALVGPNFPAMPCAADRKAANAPAARPRADLFANSQRDHSFQCFKALVIGGVQ